MLRQRLFLLFSRIVVLGLRWILYPSIPRVRCSKDEKKQTHLLIGAGERGWELIEYKELYASALEFLGPASVSRLSFSPGSSIFRQLRESLHKFQPSHYYYDARSGSQRPFRGIWEALLVGSMLERFGVVPICALTDFPEKWWRLQTAMVSARRGVVASLMSPSIVGPLYPHPRIIGPMPFSLSMATLRQLKRLKQEGPKTGVAGKALFIGMLYEPRKRTIEAIQKGLKDCGIPMEIIGRNPDGKRISDADYWQYISDARLVVSTASQISERHTDTHEHTHFIYKFIEVTAAGTALAIEPVEDSEHLLTPNVHYLSYTSVDEAVEKICRAWFDPLALGKIAIEGHTKTQKNVESHQFWRQIFKYTGLSLDR